MRINWDCSKMEAHIVVLATTSPGRSVRSSEALHPAAGDLFVPFRHSAAFPGHWHFLRGDKGVSMERERRYLPC